MLENYNKKDFQLKGGFPVPRDLSPEEKKRLKEAKRELERATK